ncbi:hCG2036967 [Homo sapiens]|uniref:HCG2036967 n=1 Tax=Homo sapiens TaxID=9606 RepID=Q969H1_HUMAN|nr:hCG2036967 [Homo sapiens]BAB70883.1 unnamed protein product [Homo sapiens]BAB70911.1 unnamed protein product [Homo sapiens]
MGRMSLGHVRDLHCSLSHYRPGGLEGKKWFSGPGLRHPPLLFAALKHGTLRPQLLQLQLWLKGANIQLRPLFQRVQSPSFGSLHMVLGLQEHRSQELRFGNLCLDFRGCMEMPGCPDRSLLQG